MWIDLEKVRIRKIVLSVKKGIKNLKNLKHYIFVIKHYFFLVFVTNAEVKMEKIFKEEESIEIINNFRFKWKYESKI